MIAALRQLLTLSRTVKFLLTLLAASAAALLSLLSAPPHKTGSLANRSYQIQHGRSFREVAQSLTEAGIVRSAWAFELLAFARHERQAIRSGEYEFEAGSYGSEVLAALVAGDVKTYSVTLVEGKTLDQVLESLWGSEALAREIDNADDAFFTGLVPPSLPGQASDNERSGSDEPVGVHELHESIEIDELVGYSLAEGLFAPDTYRYTRGDSDRDLLQRAYKLQQGRLDSAWRTRVAALPFQSPYEALILASIVEKESGLKSERGRVAGVFTNRLRESMRLQSDPTTIYGAGDNYTGALTRAQLREATPFNTYRIAGLPPTPIASVSQSSLAAVLAPEEHDFYYFVADGAGGHVFSSTLAEHNTAVAKYRALEQVERQSSKGVN